MTATMTVTMTAKKFFYGILFLFILTTFRSILEIGGKRNLNLEIGESTTFTSPQNPSTTTFTSPTTFNQISTVFDAKFMDYDINIEYSMYSSYYSTYFLPTQFFSTSLTPRPLPTPFTALLNPTFLDCNAPLLSLDNSNISRSVAFTGEAPRLVYTGDCVKLQNQVMEDFDNVLSAAAEAANGETNERRNGTTTPPNPQSNAAAAAIARHNNKKRKYQPPATATNPKSSKAGRKARIFAPAAAQQSVPAPARNQLPQPVQNQLPQPQVAPPIPFSTAFTAFYTNFNQSQIAPLGVHSLVTAHYSTASAQSQSILSQYLAKLETNKQLTQQFIQYRNVIDGAVLQQLQFHINKLVSIHGRDNIISFQDFCNQYLIAAHPRFESFGQIRGLKQLAREYFRENQSIPTFTEAQNTAFGNGLNVCNFIFLYFS